MIKLEALSKVVVDLPALMTFSKAVLLYMTVSIASCLLAGSEGWLRHTCHHTTSCKVGVMFDGVLKAGIETSCASF